LEDLKMILLARSVGIAKGKNAGAVAQAKAVVDYLKEKMGADIEVGVPVGRSPMRIVWISRHDNMGSLEEAFDTMATDAAFQELVAKGLDNFVEGSMEDRIVKFI